MSNTARSTLFNRIVEDLQIDSTEVSLLYGLVFDETPTDGTPTEQADIDNYSYLIDFLRPWLPVLYFQDSSPWDGVNQNETLVRALLNGFPGNWEIFKKNLKRDYGIEAPQIKESELTLDNLTLGKTETGNWRISIDLHDGDKTENKTWEIKNSASDLFALTKSETLFSDVIQFLYNSVFMAPNNFSAEKTELAKEILALMIPYNIENVDLLHNQKKLQRLLGATTQASLPISHTEEDNLLKIEDFPVPVFYEAETDPQIFSPLLAKTKGILSQELLDFLANNGLRVYLCDFEKHSATIQQKAGDKSVGDFSALSLGYYNHDNKTLYIDTKKGDLNELLETVVHEIGHVVNFIIQNQSHLSQYTYADSDDDYFNPNSTSITSWDIKGPQFFDYLRRIRFDTAQDWFVSSYASTNVMEDFAELFTHMMLRRTGHEDFLDHAPGCNPVALKSPLLTNPRMYIVMEVILNTIENRASDPESFNILMEEGISDELYQFAVLKAGQIFAGGIEELDWARANASPEEIQKYENSVKEVVLKTPLSQLEMKLSQEEYAQAEAKKIQSGQYTTKYYTLLIPQIQLTSPEASVPDYQKKSENIIRKDFAAIADPAIAALYVSEEGDPAPYSRRKRISDYDIISLCAELQNSELTDEQKSSLFFYFGLKSEKDLEELYAYSALKREDLAPLLDQTQIIKSAGELSFTDYRSKFWKQRYGAVIYAIYDRQWGYGKNLLQQMRKNLPTEQESFYVFYSFLFYGAYALETGNEEAKKTAHTHLQSIKTYGEHYKNGAFEMALSNLEIVLGNMQSSHQSEVREVFDAPSSE